MIEHGTRFAFVMLDIDNFKQMNDTQGHAFGDRILCTVAAVLRGVLREDDVISRPGGDEFVLLLSGVEDDEVAMRRMQTVRMQLLEAGQRLNGVELHCSLGAALAGAGVQDWNIVYEQADRALYQAKRDGKRRCRVWQPEQLPIHRD